MTAPNAPFAERYPSSDSRFDEAENDVDRGEPWRFREADAPNPLTILVTEWSTGVTKLGDAEFMNGVDREGNRWSVLVGSVVLTKKLIDGLVEEWDVPSKSFVVVETLGRVEPGEVVSIKYLGDKEGAQYTYPNFKVSRKAATGDGTHCTDHGSLEATDAAINAAIAAEAKPAQGTTDDDIPF